MFSPLFSDRMLFMGRTTKGEREGVSTTTHVGRQRRGGRKFLDAVMPRLLLTPIETSHLLPRPDA